MAKSRFKNARHRLFLSAWGSLARLEPFGLYRVDKTQIETVISRLPTKGPKKATFVIEPHAMVCGEHVFDIIKPHIQEAVWEASGKDGTDSKMAPRGLVNDVLKATGTHANSPPKEVKFLGKRNADEDEKGEPAEDYDH